MPGTWWRTGMHKDMTLKEFIIIFLSASYCRPEEDFFQDCVEGMRQASQIIRRALTLEGPPAEVSPQGLHVVQCVCIDLVM